MNSFATRLPAFRAAALRQPILRAPIVRSTQSTILQQTKLSRARTFTTTPVTRRSKVRGQPASRTATNEFAGRWRRTERYANVCEQPAMELIVWDSTHHQPETTNVEANATRADPSFHRHFVCPHVSVRREDKNSLHSSFALGAAAFALGRKLMTDKTLRLTKSKKAVQHSGGEAEQH